MGQSASYPRRSDVSHPGASIARESSFSWWATIGSVRAVDDSLINPGKLEDYYFLGAVLGSGAWGCVLLARPMTGSGAIYAVKSINKLKREDCSTSSQSLPERLRQAKRRDADKLKLEIALLKSLKHDNIVRLIDSFEDSSRVHLVMELCTGGMLLEFLLDSGNPWTEKQVAHLMRQIFAATAYMHSMEVCHRDLKPENIMAVAQTSIEANTLKVIDFGLSSEFKAGQEMRQIVGTIHFVAPQVLAGRYNHTLDLWSCGVILFILLCGYPPFHGDSDSTTLALIRRGNYAFNPEDWSSISEEAKSLIRDLLRMNQAERCSAETALQHPWIQALQSLPTRPLASARQNLKAWRCGEGVWTAVTGLFSKAVNMLIKDDGRKSISAGTKAIRAKNFQPMDAIQENDLTAIQEESFSCNKDVWFCCQSQTETSHSTIYATNRI